MDSITKFELVKALTRYYAEAQTAPDNFTEPGDPAEDAFYAAEYIFEIAAEQTSESVA